MAATLVLCIIYTNPRTTAHAQTHPTGPAAAAPATAVPTLTAEQKKDIQLAMQQVRIGELELDRARMMLAQVLQSLQRDGFDLDLNTGTYVKRAEKKEPPKSGGD